MQRPELRDDVQSRLRRCWSPEADRRPLALDYPDIQPCAIRIRRSMCGWRPTIIDAVNAGILLVPVFWSISTAQTAVSQKHACRRLRLRPEIIECRERYCDWEGHTIISPLRSRLVSLVERKSVVIWNCGYYRSPDWDCHLAIYRRLSFESTACGSEFSRPEGLTASLHLDVFLPIPTRLGSGAPTRTSIRWRINSSPRETTSAP